jgi:5-methylcytosine-specific restriction endonuclease McrA
MARSEPLDEVNLIGKTFGKLVVVSPSGRVKSHRMWKCRCHCGVEKQIRQEHLISEGTVSCGCFRNTPKLRPYEYLYNRIKKGKHAVTLSYEEFLEFTKEPKCHYCGAPVRFKTHIYMEGESATNLDRKDNLLGYSKSNCVVCCKRCNVGKNSNFTYEEWVQIGALIKSWHT